MAVALLVEMGRRAAGASHRDGAGSGARACFQEMVRELGTPSMRRLAPANEATMFHIV